jgi:hypothetical protein
MVAINGFSVVNYGNATLAPFKVPGTDVTLSLRKETAPLLLEFAAWFHRNIEALVKGECWGHAYRAVRGSTTPSFHSAGIAIDLNAPRHVLGKRGTYLPASKVTAIRAKARSLGLRWGGDYTNRADEMHFEIIVDRAAALDLVKRLQAAAKAKPTANPWETYVKARPGTRTLALYSRGDDVKFLQRFLGLADDGSYGTATQNKVKGYQKMRGLTADGVTGPLTWRSIAVGTPLR